MSKRNLKSAKSSKTKIDKKKLDIYDQFRPHSGIKYYLSQTEVNWNAGVPRVHVKHTTVEYEPGQDLTTPPVDQDASVMRYTQRKCRGPVWKFQEEIEAEKREERAKQMKKIVMKRLKASASKSAQSQKNRVHDHIIHSIGPKWYHELSNKQMHTADNLKDALLKDHANKTVQNTQDMLTDLGLAVWPHHTKIAYALKKYYKCPVEFLLKLYQLNRSKNEIAENSYTLDNRILLSAVVHLTMRNTLRELHLRIPSPPKVKKGKHTAQVKKKLKNHPSPYLNPFPFIPQPDPEAIAKHRRKEYPKSRYFNYVDDMYEVYYEVQSESTIRKQKNKKHQSKYDKPPKIPVRQLARKLIGEKKYRLRKPSVYVNPCDSINEEPKKLIMPKVDENTSSKVSKEDTTAQKEASIKEKSAATIVTKQSKKTVPSPEGNEQKLENEAMKNEQNVDKEALKYEQNVDKEEEITDDCTCEPVREIKIEKKPIENNKFYLCTCGQADKEEKERNYNKQRYQHNKQFIYNLNMYNIENNTFYYPCTCHQGQIGKRIKLMNEENKETRNKEQKSSVGNKKQTEKSKNEKQTDETENKEPTKETQNKESTDDKNKEQPNDNQNKEQTNDQNREKPDETQNKEKIDKKADAEKTGQDDKPKQKEENKKPKKSFKLGITDQKDNVNADENIVQRGNRTIRKSMANIKVSVASQGDTTESNDKDKSDEEEIKEDDEESSEPKKDEKCRCMKLYDKYMDKHEYCLDLFEDYKLKIEADIKEYMKDIEENRCTCGDSSEVCNEHDRTEDDNIEKIVEGCSYGNAKRKHDKKEDANIEEIMEGCSCGNTKVKHDKKHDANIEEIMEGCSYGNAKRKHDKKEDANIEEIMEGCSCGNTKVKHDKKHDANIEEIMEGCTCNKHRKPSKDQREMSDMNNFMGCICGSECDCGTGNANYCNSGRNDYYRCTCGDNEDRHTTINGFKLCTCKTNQDHASTHKTNKDTSILSTILEEIDDIKKVHEESKIKLPTSKNKQKIPDQLSHSKVSKKSSSKTQHIDEDSQEEIQVTSGTEVAKEVDSRIFVLKKFPKRKKQQMILLKKALAALAQDGYPLAKLPDCHKLPHFQVWLDKRSGKYLTIAQRKKYLEESRMLWNHIEICKRPVSLPELGIHPSVARKMTWEGAYKYKRMITNTMYGFSRKLKQAYVSEAQEFFPTTFHHKMPNKTFRDVYFAYLPSDEHQINVYRPWQQHEY